MRGEALDGERPGDADLSLVVVGLVVEVFEVGLGGDGGVDFLLARDALLPPFGVQLLCLLGPFVVGLARDFPFFPLLLEGRVELLAQRFERALELLPDHVDLGVVGDGLERDVRHALIDEALADVAVGGSLRWNRLCDFGFFLLAVLAVGEQVVRIASAHDAGAGQRERDAGSVDGDPAAAPLLGDVGRGARAAGGVENEIAGVGGHQDAAFNDFVAAQHPSVTCSCRPYLARSLSFANQSSVVGGFASGFRHVVADVVVTKINDVEVLIPKVTSVKNTRTRVYILVANLKKIDPGRQ